MGSRIEEKNNCDTIVFNFETVRNTSTAFFPDGGWSLSRNAIASIEVNLAEGSNILEFGSGEGTRELCREGFRLLSVEDNKEYVGLYHSNYCFAPIKDGWYDMEKVQESIKGKIFDAIIIDGPANGQRSKILNCKHIDFDSPKFILVDDTDRDEDLKLFNHLKQNKRYKKYDNYGLIFND